MISFTRVWDNPTTRDFITYFLEQIHARGTGTCRLKWLIVIVVNAITTACLISMNIVSDTTDIINDIDNT